jgi:hypothetical protein
VIWNTIIWLRNRVLLGKFKEIFDPRDSLSVSGVLSTAFSSGSPEKQGKLAFIKSSLILMQGKPSADASLITMLSARLFSLPLPDNDLKSFVKNVPIPKVAVRTTHSSEPKDREEVR